MARQVTLYWRIFLEHYGDLPHPCAYEPCGQAVTELTRPGQGWGVSADHGVIHHVDENPENNDPNNLQIMHHSCHRKHHTIGKPAAHGYTQEVRDKISATLTGRRHPDDMKAKISATMKGRAPANIGELAKARSRCECGMISSRGAIASHAKRKGHVWERL